MLANSLEYLLDHNFVWTLNPWEDWDEMLRLGPGICLLFVAFPFQREFLLAAARETDVEVTELAAAWVRDESAADRRARRYVRFGAFSNAEERSEVFRFVLTKIATPSNS